MTELLPCPFCGASIAERKGGMFHPDNGEPECVLDGLSWNADYYRTAWNRRAPDLQTVHIPKYDLGKGDKLP